MGTKKETVSTDKFLNIDDLQSAELKKMISECIVFIREKTAPALDLLTPATAERLTNQFLLEKKAEFLLDEQAIKDGFANEADRQLQALKKKAEDEALEAAKIATEKKLKEDEEKAAIEQAAKEAAELQAKRDQEDAEAVAKLKAQLKAGNSAVQSLGL